MKTNYIALLFYPLIVMSAIVYGIIHLLLGDDAYRILLEALNLI